MNKEEFIKQRCEIDKITEEEFERTYRVVECNCGKIYCKGYRCLDLDDLLKENQQLKDNWNKLREWIVYNKHNENTKQRYLVVDYGTLLGKMQELEQGSDK